MALTKITTSVIAANTLGTANIADNSIDATKIAANSILTRHIDDDQITGDQLADDITIAGNLTITGNLTTNGASVTNSSTNTTIEDAIIELGTGTSGAPATDAGIVIERGSLIMYLLVGMRAQTKSQLEQEVLQEHQLVT